MPREKDSASGSTPSGGGSVADLLRWWLERYGHLAPDFMRYEVTKLRLGVEAPVAAAAAGAGVLIGRLLS